MATRDPDAKRRQLIDAALAEFAAYGIAGARIDRIAKAAQCSAGLVYTYFGSKEELFTAVFDSIVERAIAEAPITPDDLPEYAGRFFDAYEDHPEVVRFMTWYRLEGAENANATAAASTQKKIAAIAAAQKAGTVPDRFSAVELLGLVLHIASIWTTTPPEFGSLVAQYSRKRRRELVVSAVAALLE